MSNQNIGISASLDDKTLLDSIDKTLKNIEVKFTDFSKTIESQMNGLANVAVTAGQKMGDGLASGTDKGLREIRQKMKEAEQSLRTDMGKSMASGTFKVDDAQTLRNLQIAKDEARKLYENAAIGSQEFKNIGKTIGEIDARLRQLNMKPVSTTRVVTGKTTTVTSADIASEKDYASAMAMGTATIQERMNKLKALKEVQRNLSTSDADYQSKIAAVNKEMSNLKKSNQEAMTSGVQLEKGNNKLMQSFENLGRRVLFYFSLGALTGFAKQLIDIRAQYEILERSMGALLDDMDRGSQIFNQIKARALKSPFTVLQLAGAAKQLIAYDFAENQVVETTSRLADISAALGVPMERLVYNLGQIRAQTVLTARDARDFANAGLPIIKKLSDMYTEQEGKIVSTGEVYTRMTKRMVSFNDVMKVLVGLTNEGGMFYDFQTKQAQTLQGQLSNLTDAYNIFLNELGKSNQGLLTGGISAVRALFNNWKGIVTIINSLVASYGLFLGWQKLVTLFVGRGNATIEKSILVNKRKIASDLERKQVTEQLSAAELRVLQTRNVATVSDYRQVLVSKQMSAQQLKFLALLNFRNTAMLQAIVRTGALSAAEVRAAASARELGNVFKILGVTVKSVFTSIYTFISRNIITLALMYLIGIFMRVHQVAQDAKSDIKELNDAYSELRTNIGNISMQFQIAVKDGERTGDLTQARAKMQELLDLAKEKYNIEFTVDVSKMNAQQIVKTFNNVKSELSEIMSFSQVFSQTFDKVHTAADMYKDLGDKAQAYYNVLISNKNTIASQMREHISQLNDTQKAALLSLETEKQGSESNMAYVNRLTKAYKELGLIDKSAWWVVSENRIIEATRKLGVTYSDVFSNIGAAYSDYNKEVISSTDDTKKILQNLAQQININKIPEKDRTLKLKAAIDSYSKEKALNQFAKEFLYWSANQNFGVHIKVDADKQSLVETEKVFDDWRANLQDYADKNKIAWQMTLDSTPFGERGDTKKKLQDDVNNYQTMLNQRTNLQKNLAKGGLLIDLEKGKEDLGKLNKSIQETSNEIAKSRENALWAGNTEQEVNDIINGGTKARNEQAKAIKSESDAIKKEIELINNLNTTYEKLTNAGWKQSDVLDYLKKQYATSASEINKLLAKSGLKQIDLAMFKGTMTPDNIVKLLKEQLKTATGANKINLEVEINRLTVEAAEYDVTKLIEGLQNSIDNIKEGYELSLDIQASPEMADLFQNIFGLDLSTLPKSIDDTVERIQTDVNAKIKESEKGTGNMLPFLDITKTDIDKWAQDAGLSDGDKNVLVKGLKNAQKTAQDLIKKDFTDTEKAWKELLTKYADYSVKKQKIDETAQKERLTLISKTGTPTQRKTAAELNVIYSTATTDEERKLIEDKMETLINQISLSNKNVIPLKIAIDNKQAQDAADAAFDAFKQTDEYVKAFSDLNKLGVQSIIEIKKKFEEFKASEKGLSPESLKAIEETVKKLDDNLLQRDPIGTMIRGIKDWKAAKADIASVDREIAKYEEELLEISNARAKVAEAEKAVKAAKATGDIQAQFDAQERLNDAISQSTEIVGKYGDVELKLKDAQGRRTNATDKEQKAQSDVTDGAEKTVTTISSMILNSQLLKDVMGETGQKVVNAFEKITMAVITATKETGAAAAASNVYLAIAQAILTVADTIYSLVGTKDDKLMRDFDELGQEIEWLKKKLQEIENLDFFDVNQVSAYMKSLLLGVTSFNNTLAGIPQEMDTLNKKYKKGMTEAVLSANHALAGLTPISMLTPITSSIVTSSVRDGKVTWHRFFSSLKSIATLGLSDLFTAMGNKKGREKMQYLQKLYNNELEYTIKLQKIIANQDYGELQKSGEAQIALIEKQNKDLQEQINIQMKRKAKKRDVEKIAELEQQQQELAYQKAMVYAKLIKENYGDIFADLSSGISSALKDAFDNSTDPAKAFKSAWKDAIESMIWNMVKVKAIMPLLETWMKGFYKAMGLNEDGTVKEGTVPDLTLTPEEAAQLRSSYEKISDQAQSIYQGGADLLKALGITAGSESENLSNLQKGIQSVTETTADAIEGYMNNVMGQSYRHTEQLDALIAQGEVGMGHNAAILLQLQQSYAMQSAIQQILNGALSANGRGFNVYLQS